MTHLGYKAHTIHAAYTDGAHVAVAEGAGFQTRLRTLPLVACRSSSLLLHDGERRLFALFWNLQSRV